MGYRWINIFYMKNISFFPRSTQRSSMSYTSVDLVFDRVLFVRESVIQNDEKEE